MHENEASAPALPRAEQLTAERGMHEEDASAPAPPSAEQLTAERGRLQAELQAAQDGQKMAMQFLAEASQQMAKSTQRQQT